MWLRAETVAEVSPEAFAAYMGVAFRAPVAAGADFVLRQPSLAPVLSLAATAGERARLREGGWEALLARGDAALREG